MIETQELNKQEGSQRNNYVTTIYEQTFREPGYGPDTLNGLFIIEFFFFRSFICESPRLILFYLRLLLVPRISGCSDLTE